MGYTMPTGRRATSRQQREREKLLRERETCRECKDAARRAVETSDYRPGACQCPEHRSR